MEEEEEERMKRRREEKEERGKNGQKRHCFFFFFFFFLENPKWAARASPDREVVPRRFNTSLVSAEFYSPTIE